MSILEAAEKIIGERGKDYGDPKGNLAAIAQSWSAYLHQTGCLAQDEALEASDVAIMMALLKLIRQGNRHKDDNLLDAIAYIELAARV
jgi:hypothetical protein